jgi:tetratricopeptide (TPR) repeat protein
LPSSHTTGFELFSSPAKRTFVLSLVVIAATLALYLPVAQNEFVNFDDDKYIITNPHVLAGLKWSTVQWAFTTFWEGNWDPLTWLSHALDCQMFGLHAGGHHLVSALLHALNVALLFWLLERANGFTWRSLAVASLFAVHPINVESVAWAAERKNVLSMLFFLLALLAYDWYARKPELHRYAAVFLLFAMALMSKPQVIAFPFLVLLLDYWPLRRIVGLAPPGSNETPVRRQFSVSRILIEKLPLILLSLASSVITVLAQREGHALRGAAQFSLLNRVENALMSYVRYLDMAIWPVNLAVFYPHPTKLFPVWQVAAAAAILVLLTAFVIWQRQTRPYLMVGWFWFVGAMLPMSGIVQVGGHALADRFAYIPFIGLFVIAAWAIAERPGLQNLPAAWVAIPAAVILIALGSLTHRQIGYWRDSEAMWLRGLAVTDNNFVAHDDLAIFLSQRGRLEEAVPHMRAALVIRPDDPLAALSLGAYDHAHGDLPGAIEHYKYVALHSMDPDLRSNAYANLGSAYRQQGLTADAKHCFEESLRLVPNRPIAIVGLGLIALQDRDSAAAVQQFSQAMSIEPTAVGYLLLARALNQSGRTADAEAARRSAQQLSPSLDEAQKDADTLLGSK